MPLPRHENPIALGDKLNLLAGIIKTRSRAALTDGNKILESIMRRTFNALFDWNLTNLDDEKLNFPAVDLADRTRRLAVQVTNEASSDKIARTAAKASEHDLRLAFDKVIVFFLLAEKPGFPRSFKQPDGGLVIETWDNSDVVRRATGIEDQEAVRRAIAILDEEMGLLARDSNPSDHSSGDAAHHSPRFDHSEYGLSRESEQLVGSFFPVIYPDDIQSAKITLKRGVKLSERIEMLWAKLKLPGMPPVDYYIERDGSVFTFDSFDAPIWRSLLEDRAIKVQPSLKASTWANSPKLGERNRFTKLLQRNLEQLCNNVGTESTLGWSKDLKCYLFQARAGVKTGKIKVEALKKSGTREVFRAIPNTLPGREGEIQHWKHQGFRHRFMTFGGEWFLNVEPFWAFTCDGKTSASKMHGSSSRNMRKPERNRAVLGHVLFWASVLCKRSDDMFSMPASIRLVRPPTFDVMPSINDSTWKDIEPEDEKKVLTADSKEELCLL